MVMCPPLLVAGYYGAALGKLFSQTMHVSGLCQCIPSLYLHCSIQVRMCCRKLSTEQPQKLTDNPQDQAVDILLQRGSGESLDPHLRS